MKIRKTFVLIVGGGPTGVSAGMYLQKFRIPHILIEKDTYIKEIPKAHYYNSQTMEAWRHIYHLDKCFLNETENVHLWKNFSYCLNLNSDKILGTYNNFNDKYMFKNTYYENVSPSKVTHISQYRVLAILYNYYLNNIQGDANMVRRVLTSVRLRFSSYRILKQLEKIKKQNADLEQKSDSFLRFCEYDPSQILLGYEYKKVLKYENIEKTNIDKSDNVMEDEHRNAVLSLVKNVTTGEEETIISNYVFVADGGKSSIKRDLNINDEKDISYMKFVNVHFHSKQLIHLIKRNPSMLYFIFNEYIGILVIHNFEKGEVILHIPYLTEKEKELYSDKTKCLRIIEKLINFNLSDINIHNIYLWTMRSSIASTFIDKRSNRIIFLGDAAHKLPPSGGFGLNLGIGEVLNITWKIGRIFLLKQNAFLDEKNKKKSNLIDNFQKNESKSDTYTLLEKTKRISFSYDQLLNRVVKKQIQKILYSYNIERKLVAEYTIDSAVKNYNRGNSIPDVLGYKYKYMQYGKQLKLNCLINNSKIFYYMFKKMKKILTAINNIPYIYEINQKKIHELFRNPSNLLTLLYPGVDLGYAYINTMIDDNEQKEIEHIKKHDTINDIKKYAIFENEKEKIPRLKICTNVYNENSMTTIIGSKIPHFTVYSFCKNYIYRMSTVDIPLFNNSSFSYLILLFDYSLLNDVLSHLSKKKKGKNKFNFCLWDSEILVESKGKELFLFKDNPHSTILDKNSNEAVIIKNTPFLNTEMNKLGDISKIKGEIHSIFNFNVNLIFSSKLIQQFFFKTLHLKTKNAFVILRPDKHIISAGDENLLEKIEEVDMLYL